MGDDFIGVAQEGSVQECGLRVRSEAQVFERLVAFCQKFQP